MKILVLNSGSSSQKCSLYEIGDSLPGDAPAPLWEGKIEWHDDVAEAEGKNARGATQKDRVKVASRVDAVRHFVTTLWEGLAQVAKSRLEIDIAGHCAVNVV